MRKRPLLALIFSCCLCLFCEWELEAGSARCVRRGNTCLSALGSRLGTYIQVLSGSQTEPKREPGTSSVPYKYQPVVCRLPIVNCQPYQSELSDGRFIFLPHNRHYHPVLLICCVIYCCLHTSHFTRKQIFRYVHTMKSVYNLQRATSARKRYTAHGYRAKEVPQKYTYRFESLPPR